MCWKTCRYGSDGRAPGNGVSYPDLKACKPYEFSAKMSVTVTHKQCLMVNAHSFTGNPFDGHMLAEQLEQIAILTEDVASAPEQVIVNLECQGMDADNPGVEIIHRAKFKSLTRQQQRWLKRRQAAEPAIGRCKHNNAMDRCWLQGQTASSERLGEFCRGDYSGNRLVFYLYNNGI